MFIILLLAALVLVPLSAWALVVQPRTGLFRFVVAS